MTGMHDINDSDFLYLKKSEDQGTGMTMFKWKGQSLYYRTLIYLTIKIFSVKVNQGE